MSGISDVAEDLFCTTPREQAVEALHEATAIYTAEPVVDSLLERISWPLEGRKLLDPSCGDGVFLGRALQKLLEKDPYVGSERLCGLIEGWEIHPGAAQQARHRVVTLLRSRGWGHEEAADAAGRMVINNDFLTGYGGCLDADFIVGNPPYLRIAGVPSLLRREYETCLPDYAKKDLLHSFLSRCAEILRPGGEIAFVTADRWLFNVGAADLREILGRRIGISHLERLDPDSCFYRPKLRRVGTAPRVHPVAIVMKGGEAKIPLGRRAIYPDAAAETAEGARTLSDVATVRVCPWLGKHGIFVVGEDVASKLPPECLIPAVDTDDIKDGVLQPPSRFAIRTVPGVPPAPEVAGHLRTALDRLPSTGRRHKDWWLPPETFHRLPLTEETLLIPRIAKGLCFYRLKAGILGINHNLTVVASGSLDLDSIEETLGSPAAREWVRSRAPRLENGYLSITTSLLRELPVSL